MTQPLKMASDSNGFRVSVGFFAEVIWNVIGTISDKVIRYFTDSFRQPVLVFQLVRVKIIGERSLFHAGGIYGKHVAQRHNEIRLNAGLTCSRGRLALLLSALICD